ncbi:ABC-F family ATP-binding cassette domain-containing protein [Desulfovibrio subterraneus]|jgi:ATP-binding cassette subfamily F protein 3|uniref:ABC-F family ATP-binding cassette domain-containing protein n=1 Tax=Desulfovibrio subterraneus TaxID=2718620 RepID=UPI0022B87B53|nr:ABC-F family ATP-binding cassette domain-containing protein [Desulfovibrio subterraneus]WBF69088.1 ABC-F family ATP-binding cassette domain-containing protein [Desulfovibrio subterraneus]
MNINIQNLTKTYGGHDLFANFSLEIQSGVRLCVCGPNGCGKSTLIKLIAGVTSSDGGKVSMPKECRLGYVAQEMDENLLETPLLTWVLEVLPDWNDFWAKWEAATEAGDESALKTLGARQAELEQIYGHNPEHRAKTVLSGLGFAERKWHMSIGQLSGGWRERAKLARVLTAGADVLLLDEPTNHLDLEAVEWLENFLLEYTGVLVFVAHDRVFMDKIGTHVLYLGASKPMFRKGNFTQFLALQDEIEAQKVREQQRLAGEIERKMDFVRRFKAKASKARQAGSKQKMAARLEKELSSIQVEAKRRTLAFKWPEPVQADKTVLSVVGLDYSFDDGTRLWPNLDFQLYRDMRVALVGHNGCGKSTLLKLIAGRLEKDGGNVVMGSKVRMGYYSQHQLDILNASGTALGEIRRLSDPRTTEEELMSVLGLFMLGQSFFDRQVSTLSGGEKSRLLLATLFLSRSNFLVLDEPTNHLDLESREALVEALDAFDGTIFMVAHDRYLLSSVADQVWSLDENGFTVYESGFEEYDKARRQLASEAAGKDADAARGGGLSRDEQKRIKRQQAELRNTIYKELKPKQEAFAKLEKEFEASLEEQGEVEAMLADPAVYADSGKASDLLKRFHALQAKGEELMEKMGELEVVINELEARKAALVDDVI